MLFYDDFVKKVKQYNVDIKENYSFGLNFTKRLVWLGTGTPITFIGVFQLWMLKINGGHTVGYVLAILMLIFGIYNIKMAFSYKIKILGNKLINKQLTIELDKVKLVELRKMVAPKTKKLEACLDIITHDKKQIILPLIMNNKLQFTAVIKEITGDKFVIIKD